MLMSVTFNKTCSPVDWEIPEIRRIMKDELHLRSDCFTHIERKHWEWAMGFHALEKYNYLKSDHIALGIGSGHEAIMYALTNHLGYVIGTDLYGNGEYIGSEADRRIFKDPSQFCDFPYPKNRLLIQEMNACNLTFNDNAFDILFSFSSLEHFGKSDNIKTAIKEAYRVLKPGGIFVLSVDYAFRYEGNLNRDKRTNLEGELLTKDDVQEFILETAPFFLKEDIQYEVDELINIYDITTGTTESGNSSPHIHLKANDMYFTSLMLILFKY